MKKVLKIAAGVIVLIIIGAGLFIYKNSRTPNVASDCSTSTRTIVYTKEKVFSPACIKVSSGATVTYVNNSDGELELGADPHPIHSGNKEVSNGGFTLNIAPGTSKATTVNKVGTFGFHDHLHFSARGVIVVQ